MNVSLIQTHKLNVFEHMALDDVLFSAADKKSLHTIYLRFYNWKNTAGISFGYTQPYNLIVAQIKDIGSYDIVRRPTAGGIVKHEDDLTFSLILPNENINIKQVYSKLHNIFDRAISKFQKGVKRLKIKTNVNAYKSSSGNMASDCFVQPVESDLIDINGKKILGGAIRKFKNVMLYQGSLQFTGTRNNIDLQKSLSESVALGYNAKISEYKLPNYIFEQMSNKAEEVYHSVAWLKKF